MTDVEQSPWLNITDLNTLNNADPALSGDDAAAIVPQSDGINDATQANLRQTLNTLAASTNDIKRFNASILTASPTMPSRPPQASKRGAGSSSTRTASWPCTRWAAKIQPEAPWWKEPGNWRPCSSTAWPSHRRKNVNVVSETAQMPVTISNSHPYPVTVKVSSLTNSMQIVTSRFDTVEVPAHGEAQVAFIIRVATSGTADARSACRTGRASHSERHKPPTSPAHCRSATKPASSSSASRAAWSFGTVAPIPP